MTDADFSKLVELRDREALRQALQGTHPADIADFVEKLDDEDRLFVFSVLSDRVAAEVLDEAEAGTTYSLLEGTTAERMSGVLEHLESDDAAELLAEMPAEDATEILNRLEDPLATAIQNALAHDEDTAGRLMTSNFVSLEASMPAWAALAAIRDQVSGPDAVFYVYVVDEQGVLTGVVSIRALVLAKEKDRIGEIASTNVARVSVHADREEVAHTMAKYDLLAMPVVDDDGKLIGTVTIDDAIDVLEAEAAEDLLRISGSFEPPQTRPRVFAPVFYRLPWLLVTIAGELVVALVLSGHIEKIQRVIALALFTPIVAATAGSVGTQSLASALGQLQENKRLRQILLTVFREMRTGLMLGVLGGAIAGSLALLWQADLLLGIVIGATMAIAMTISAVLGAAVPLALKKARADPTIASGPLITTINDAVSLNIYLIIAGLLLSRAG